MKTIYNARYRQLIAFLRQTRRDRGITQAQLAAQLGWHRHIISRIENRDRRMDILETTSVCEILGLRISDLESILME